MVPFIKLIMKRLFFIFCLLISCSHGQSKFETVLTKDSCYWVFFNYPDEQINKKNSTISGCTRFLPDGNSETFLVNDSSLEPMMYLDKRSPDFGKWKFNEKDSSFDFTNQPLKVIKYTNDTITLINNRPHIEKLVRMTVKQMLNYNKSH